MDEQTNALLDSILRKLDSDQYESLGLYTIGGPPGNYQLRSPVNTEFEYLVVGAYLAAASGTGTVVITNNNPITNFTLGTALGASSSGSDMNNAFEGVVLPTSGTINSLIAVDYWMPAGRGANVYVLVLTTASYALIATRRKLERYIPVRQRIFPKTHSQPPPRRWERMLPAESAQVAGFESQYPTPGGKPYQHTDGPPVDPGWQRKGQGR